jgi:hypothetical protein
MPQLSIDLPHTLGQEEAARRLKERFEFATEMYRSQLKDFNQQWDDHTFSFGFHAMGMKVAGTLAVEPAQVKLNVNLPLAAMLFKKTIEERVRHEVGRMLT